MPQLLHFLSVDRRARVPQVSVVFRTYDVFGSGARRGGEESKTRDEADDIDWGVLAIYTCSASCVPPAPSTLDVIAYPEEFVWMQAPPADPMGTVEGEQLSVVQEEEEAKLS